MTRAGEHRSKRIIRQITGFSCLAAGVAGCILPVIPGIPLLFAGLGLLAVDYKWAANLRDKVKDIAARQLARVRRKRCFKPEVVRVP